jgi:D-aminopeptidase
VKAFSPATEYVTVKKAVSGSSAESRPRAEVSRDIEAAAERALRNMKNVRPWKPAEIAKPFENQFSYHLPEQAAVASMFPHAERLGMDDRLVRAAASKRGHQGLLHTA